MPAPVVLILAAGRGERFLSSGGCTHKLAALLNGKSVLEHVIQAVETANLRWYLVCPEGGTCGMGKSISLGVHATLQAPGWLILPADLPLIQPSSLQRVAAELEESSIVVPHYQNYSGHPVGFRQEHRAELLALSGDTGAKEIVRRARQREEAKDIFLSDYGITHDIDTLADLQAAQRLIDLSRD
ncbi:nucleotidyltransferase family protein [Enterobacter oligotrophicus]|uniref:nucleotidyltransferase family protein n=1 Tax=Enterobacter TaxID=547 RepID=UPI001C032BC2|nr:nucleotidyltransferase family protein [Enterobacter oligotrophicus]ELW1648979.1 nucleotidyltransferase family protein [Enterobacter oligotrophicus]MBT9425443.1 nucleotidyltransferase family protein [Enterobacter oligotrophicus]